MSLLQSEYANEPAVFAEQLWAVSELLDHLGLHTVRTFQQSREDVIKRQQSCWSFRPRWSSCGMAFSPCR